MKEIDADTSEYVQQVLSSLSPGIRYACAYGSGVFKQSGHKSRKDNMIDFIFVVQNAFSWHAKNLRVYNDHYSFLKRFSPKTVASIQKNYGAKVFFNTRIDFNGRLIKYGVIEISDFFNDLYHWENLYIAGRLQKPVHHLKGLNDPEIAKAIEINLQSAVETALLLLPSSFTEEQLYLLIAGLSYIGDFRMVIGEDKNKVQNIVKPNMEKFHNLYDSILNRNCSLSRNGATIHQDLQPKVQLYYLNNLPKHMKGNILGGSQVAHTANTPGEILVNDRVLLEKTVRSSVSKIVRKSSTAQTIKGVFTAGISKSVLYSMEKLIKMLKSVAR